MDVAVASLGRRDRHIQAGERPKAPGNAGSAAYMSSSSQSRATAAVQDWRRLPSGALVSGS